MHRSGTSALTRVLGMGGAALPKTPLDTSEFNARGYCESTPIYQLHEEMLEALGTSWHDLSPLVENWERSELGAQFVERMAGIVLDEFGDAPLIAVKDPRICRLVPFWVQVLGALEIDPCFVIPVRNPLEVSASLAIAAPSPLAVSAATSMAPNAPSILCALLLVPCANGSTSSSALAVAKGSSS